MQSIFRLPWCSDPVVAKVSERAAIEKMRTTPMVEIPVLNKLKRKRTNSHETGSPLRLQEHKKQRPASPLQPSANARAPAKAKTEQTFTEPPETRPAVHSFAAGEILESAQPDRSSAKSISSLYQAEKPETDTEALTAMVASDDAVMSDAQPSASGDAMGLTPLQQVIENEFNMQILMKHNELRLIEQELAKCQIALEQLRRCELRPFPGSEGLSEAVSAGTGPSVAPPRGYTRPSHPAPYGVTDGPYSRHYKQWLLHDPQFDAVPMQSLSYSDAGRPTRNSGSVRKSISKPFVFPGRPSESLQSIPNYPAVPPKDKSSPLVLRRSTDGQLVKLICNNCLRGNFSSIQGFLNHCRIAHKVDYKSHDAAAIDCGRTLDENEAANLPPETHNTPTPKQSMNRSSIATSTPHRNFVHPFNTTHGTSMASANTQHGSPASRVPVRSLSSAAASTGGSPLTSSIQVPRLSAHFAKHQLGGDLAKAAASAKQKIDLGADDDLLSPDFSEQDSPQEPVAGARTVAGSGRTSMKASSGYIAQTQSRKGFGQPTQRPRPSPLATDAVRNGVKHERSEIPESPQDHALNLSPHTADSNPGLVSDHEDDDHGSVSEEEAPHAEHIRRPFNVNGSCADNMEIDVAVDDDIDEHGVIIRRNSLFAEDERGLRAAGSPSRKYGVGKRSG